MSIALVDDALLSRSLRGDRPRALRGDDLWITGCWYVRLCQAVLRADGRGGHLSGPFRDQPEPRRARAMAAVMALPPAVGLLSLRELGPLMGRLRNGERLNLLALEVLAAAIQLEADVHLSTSSPSLEAALERHGIAVHLHPS